MHALDPVQYSYNAEYLSAVTRTVLVGFYSHLYVALNVWANVWAETSYSCRFFQLGPVARTSTADLHDFFRP